MLSHAFPCHHLFTCFPVEGHNSSQLPVYFGSNVESSPYVYSAHGQSCGPEEATILELLRALHRIPLHLLRNSADQVRCLLLLRKDECTLAGETMKKKCCWGYGPHIFWLINCHHRHIFLPSATLIVETKSLLSGCAFKFSAPSPCTGMTPLTRKRLKKSSFPLCRAAASKPKGVEMRSLSPLLSWWSTSL